MKAFISTTVVGLLFLLLSPLTATAQYAYGDTYLYEDSSWHLEGYSITYNSYQLWYISVGVDAGLHSPTGDVLASGSDTEWWNGMDAYVPLAADADAGLYYAEGHYYYCGDGWGPVDLGTTRYYADTGMVFGAVQSALHPPGNAWNFRIADLQEPSGGVVRLWWSCGINTNPVNPTICYGEKVSNQFQYVGSDIVGVSYGLCDIADPTVVKFNGYYYLYASAIKSGTSPCPSGVQGNVFGFVSSDARSWTILNNGNPVITSLDPAYSDSQPSAIVMQYSYACSAGSWAASPTTPFIRVYYTAGSDIGDPGYSRFAADTYDGSSFAAHVGPGGIQGILRGYGPLRGGWWPNVKRVGVFGDYPLVMSYAGPDANYTAVTSGAPSDFNWLGANAGHIQYFSPLAFTPGSLEGLGDGTLVDSNGSPFYGYPSGSVYLWWSTGKYKWPTPIYRGPSSTLAVFPWSPYMDSCQP